MPNCVTIESPQRRSKLLLLRLSELPWFLSYMRLHSLATPSILLYHTHCLATDSLLTSSTTAYIFAIKNISKIVKELALKKLYYKCNL